MAEDFEVTVVTGEDDTMSTDETHGQSENTAERVIAKSAGQWAGLSPEDSNRGFAEHIAAALRAAGLLVEGAEAKPEWEYSVGHHNRSGRVSAEGDYDDDEITNDIAEAMAWVDEALESGTYANAILVRRQKSAWEEVSRG